MTPLLADITSAEAWILGCTIVGALTGVGALVVAIAAMNKKQEVSVDQPLNVQLLESFVTKSEFANHAADNKRDVDSIRVELREDRRNNEVHASQRSAGIYKKIDEVRSELSEKIDAMPSRIVADLRNAKGLLE